MNKWIQLTVATIALQSFDAVAASTYLGDNQNTGYAAVKLSKTLSQQWVIETPQKPAHAWKEPYFEQQFIDYDYVDHTCIAYGKIFFGSTADGAVRAVSADTGKSVWTFYTEAAVRFAPVAHENKIYFVSDDGFLYCVNEKDGSLAWKKMCAPLTTKCSGNDKIISRWPMRSGVVIEDGKLYTTAGMWSRDGVFIYCLDPKDGKEIWRNDTSGFHYSAMPHGDGYGGVTPQGPLAVSGNRLYVPSGRAAPAFFDATTGEFISHENGLGYKPHYPGGSWIMKAGKWLVFKRRQNHTETERADEIRHASEGFATGLIFYNEKNGKPEMAWTAKNQAAVSGNNMILAGAGDVIKVNFATLQKEYKKYGNPNKGGVAISWDKHVVDSNLKDLKPIVKKFGGEKKPKLWKFPKPNLMSPMPFKEWAFDAGHVYAMMVTDDQVILGGEEKITAVDLESGKKLWGADVKGWVRGIAIEDGKVVASTTEGRIYCFGSKKGSSETISYPKSKVAVSDKQRKKAEKLIKLASSTAGYGLVLGAKNPAMIFALLEKSEMVLTCYTDNEKDAMVLRKQLDEAGLLGSRANVFVGDMSGAPFIKYMFNVVFAGEEFGSKSISNPKAIYKAIRPYDGKLICLTKSAAAPFKKLISKNDSIKTGPSGFVLTRGKIVGAGAWTAPFANMGRTSNSDDDIVKAPLGILWWGGPSSRRIMSRHWISPVPLFSEGVLVIQGRSDIMAVDAYNGREMWNKEMHKVGRALMPMRGGNIIADKTHVYCVKETTAYALDLKTGETTREFEFKASDEEKATAIELGVKQFRSKKHLRLTWEYLGLMDDMLIGSLSTEDKRDAPGGGGALKSPPMSKTLFAFDKNTGKLKWRFDADRTVMPTSIVADSKHVYFLDRTPENDYLKEKKRGKVKKSACSLKAIDIKTGKVVYDTKDLRMESKSLMLSQGVIVALPNPSETVIPEASRGLTTFDSKTGKVLWSYEKDITTEWYRRRGQQGYFFINGNTLHTPYEFDLKTGAERFTRDNPITGEKHPLSMEGLNFCGGVSAGKHIALHRSSSAGYTDLDEDRGNYWLPEIRTSCWVSMLPVGGIVVSQEGMGSCTCSYSYKTSLALVPTEREEDWTIHLKRRRVKPKKGRQKVSMKDSGQVNFLRLNFGAPGDFYSMNSKNLWYAYPAAMGGSFDGKKTQFETFRLPVKGAKKPSKYHFNADYNKVEGTEDDKLFLTGLEGNQKLEFKLNKKDYEVRLMFAEVKGAAEGERVFDVLINGETMLEGFDIVAKAGGKNKAYITDAVTVNGSFKLEIKSKSGKEPLIAGIEIIKKK